VHVAVRGGADDLRPLRLEQKGGGREELRTVVDEQATQGHACTVAQRPRNRNAASGTSDWRATR